MSLVPLPDDHQPASNELYLDTSIHCSRLKGPGFVERIAKVCKKFAWCGSSTYTRMEYGNVVLAQAQYFLNKLQKEGSLERVQQFVGHVLQHASHRPKVVWSFSLLKAYGANDQECTERAILYLTRLMKQGLDFVDDTCDEPLADGTACYWSKKGVRKKRSGELVWETPSCSKAKKRCQLDDFFTVNREVFERIKVAIDDLPDEQKSDQLKGFSKVIGQAIADPAVLLDYRTGCKSLADAIIAVDGKAYAHMFSQNAAESVLLTRVLEQAFYYLPPNPDRGIEVLEAPSPIEPPDAEPESGGVGSD